MTQTIPKLVTRCNGNLSGMSTGMVIDGIAASEAIDSSGEILDVEGCDISDLEEGKGVLNWEHRGDDAPGASPNDIVGKITYAKKIYKRSDCSDERQRQYWDMVKLPYIYVRCRLFDGSEHPGAKALAAIIRDYKSNNEPILVRYSIEGSTLEKDGSRLKRSIARRVAATIKPCNKSCHSDVLEDPNAPGGAEKFDDEPKDILELKDDAKKAEAKLEHPGFSKLGGSHEYEYDPELPLDKALEAGNANAAPGALVGGAALQRDESFDKDHYKNQFKAALRDYGKDKPFNKAEFRDLLKTRMPEASDEFIDHFADTAEDFHVNRKKLLKAQIKKLALERLAKLEERQALPKYSTVEPQKQKAPKHPRQDIPTSLPAPKSPRSGDRPWSHEPAPVKPKAKPAQIKNAKPVPVFDSENGILTVGGKQFKTNTAYDEHWDKIFKNKEFTDTFDLIAKNVKAMQYLRKEGVVVPGETAIAAMLGGYSSNELVPIMEKAVNHTIDLMRKHNYDPSKGPPTQEFVDELQKMWSKSNPSEHAPELETHPKLKTKAGKYRKIGKPSDKLGTLVFFHRLAPHLDKLMEKHRNPETGELNGQAMSNDLIQMKIKYEDWKAKNRAKYDAPLKSWRTKRAKELVAQGMTDKDQLKSQLLHEERELREKGYGRWGSDEDKNTYTLKDPVVEFLSNKTIRYMVGMLGGGNIHVPDTHFVRHFYGLGQKDEKNATLLKDALLAPENAHVLNQVDEYHRKNHPAAKWVRDRYFGGKDDAASTFMGFWAHWMNIPEHERLSGVREQRLDEAANEDSTHSQFFKYVMQSMIKHGLHHIGNPQEVFDVRKSDQEGPDHAMAAQPTHMKVAASLLDIADKYGFGGAMIAYHTHMMPIMMKEAVAQHAEKQKALMNIERMTIDMRHHLANMQKGTVPFANHLIVPGEATANGKRFHLLHEDDTHYYAIPHGKLENYNMHDLSKLPKAKEGTHFTVDKTPRVMVNGKAYAFAGA